MPIGDIARSNVVRAIKNWAGMRGDVPGQIEQTIQPVMVLDEGWPMPVHEPWSWYRSKSAGGAGTWSTVGIFNKDPRPDDPGGQVKSIVIIDYVRIGMTVAADLVLGIVDSATAGLGSPTSAAAGFAAFQDKVNPPYKVTGVGAIDGLMAGLIGDQIFPSPTTTIDLYPHIYLGPGHALCFQPNAANQGISMWAQGRYYHAA